MSTAEFFVASNHRPHLLSATLDSLSRQLVPESWTYTIRVAGTPDDPARRVVEEYPLASFTPVDDHRVTAKLNILLRGSSADLILLADDDDLQPPDRLAGAVRAYTDGAAWSGVGSVCFVDLDTDRVVYWKGNARNGLIGTSLSFSRELLNSVGGWPLVDRGKDGPLARKINATGIHRFEDLTGKIGPILCTQSETNIWRRPALVKGRAERRGSFVATGLGSFAENSGRFDELTSKLVNHLIPTSSLYLRPKRKVGINQRLSVLMAACGTSTFILEAVESVLSQELPPAWTLELLIGVDDDPDVLAVLAEVDDPRLGVLDLQQGGTYKAANALLAASTGDVITRVDSDDVCLPNRFLALVEAFSDPTVDFAGTWYTEVDATLTPIRHRQVAPDGIWAFRRTTFDHLLGAWEPWSCAADAELVQRAHALGMRNKVIRECLYLHRQHDNQLTRSSGTSFGSDTREHYRSIIADRGIQYTKVRPLPLTPECSIIRSTSGGYFNTEVTACLASVAWRSHLLSQVVDSLLPQVNRLNVYLNGYDDVPSFLDDPRITVARSQEHGDRGDAGKMFWCDDLSGYVLTCDDDILYPADYVATMIAGIERYQRRAIVSFHGSTFIEPFTSFVRSRKSFRFGAHVAVDVPVHCLGTGVLGYHASTFPVRRSYFELPNMADTWLARELQRAKVPCYVLKHDAGWIMDLGSAEDYARSIYNHSHKATGTDLDTGALQTKIVRSAMPWTLYQ